MMEKFVFKCIFLVIQTEAWSKCSKPCWTKAENPTDVGTQKSNDGRYETGKLNVWAGVRDANTASLFCNNVVVQHLHCTFL